LFPKLKLLEPQKVTTVKSEKEENVPESWDMLAEESNPTEVETPCKEKNDSEEGLEEAQNLTVSADPLSPNPAVSTGLVEAAELPLQENSNDDHIVLGPGGQWGLQNDRSTNSVRVRENEAFGPRVAAWSLPTLSQQWEFSEITHHGRKKQKSLHRRKNKKASD
jgi:hypothetical protein